MNDAGGDEGPARPRRRRWWAWAACAALLVAGWLTPTLARAASPRLAAALAVCDGYLLSMSEAGLIAWSEGVDAWGARVWIWGRTPRLQARSYGPDGVDDSGGGDDLVLTKDDVALASALAAAPFASVLLAVALAGCVGSRFNGAPRSRSTPRELARAAGLATPPALLVLLAFRIVTFGDRNFGDPLAELLDERAWPSLVVPPGAAFLMAYGALAFGLAYAWRLSRPRETDGAADA